MQRRLNKINKLIDLFDKIQPPSTPLSEIKKGEVASSDCLLEQLYELSDVYRDEEGNMDEIIIDAGFQNGLHLEPRFVNFTLNLI